MESRNGGKSPAGNRGSQTKASNGGRNSKLARQPEISRENDSAIERGARYAHALTQAEFSDARRKRGGTKLSGQPNGSRGNDSHHDVRHAWRAIYLAGEMEGSVRPSAFGFFQAFDRRRHPIGDTYKSWLEAEAAVEAAAGSAP
jgi:hypothetical protein